MMKSFRYYANGTFQDGDLEGKGLVIERLSSQKPISITDSFFYKGLPLGFTRLRRGESKISDGLLINYTFSGMQKSQKVMMDEIIGKEVYACRVEETDGIKWERQYTFEND